MNYEKLSMENLQQYRTFDGKKELNTAVYKHIDVLRNDEQPASVIEVLLFLGRSSLRIKGVSFAKYQTIADSIGISKRTVIRAIKSLETYGIIEKIATVKKWRRSVNIIRIMSDMSPQNVTSVEEPEVNEDKAYNVEIENEPRYYKHLNKDLNTYTYANAVDTPYKRFKLAVTTFIGDGNNDLVYRLYGVHLAQTKALRKAYEDSELIDVAIRAIHTTFNASKTKTIRNIAGYFNGVYSKLLDDMMSELFN